MTYNQVILDSALFKKALSNNVEAFILTNNVILSQTFFHEARAFTPALNSSSCRVLLDNINKIVTMIKNHSYTLTLSSEPFDVYQRATQLAVLGKKICVITENNLLINRLLSSDALVDVYDLNQDCLIKHCNHDIPSKTYIEKSSRNAERVIGIKQGSQLSLKNNTSIVLGELIGSPGCEGKVFNVEGQPDVVAKIYKKRPSNQHALHLERLISLNNQMNFNWCLLPKSLLYHQGNLVGFTMNKVSTDMLSNDTLYLGDDEEIQKNRLSLKRSYTLSFCLMILAQIKILNCYGICVPDYNDGNFSTYSKGKAVTMFDADSFSEGGYFGNTVDDICFSKKYNIENQEELCQMCDEGALKFIFRLISLGLYPFSGKDQPYQFSNGDSQFAYRRSYFPKNVLSYLDDVFTSTKTPSLSIAIQMVSIALEELSIFPKKDITVKQMCSQVMYTPDPFTVATPIGGWNKKKENACADAPINTNVNIEEYPPNISVRKNTRKYRFWPFIVSALIIIGYIAYNLGSKGTIF